MIGTLLRQRAVTHNPSIKRVIESVLERVLNRSDAFQTFTAITPVSQVCELLEKTAQSNEQIALDYVVEFLEESFARFTRQPYASLDEAAETVNSDLRRLQKFSCILLSMAQQWRYIGEKQRSSPKFTTVTNWLVEFLLRLSIIGEDLPAVHSVLGQLTTHDDFKASAMTSLLLEDVRLWSIVLSGSKLVCTEDAPSASGGHRSVNPISDDEGSSFVVLWHFIRLALTRVARIGKRLDYNIHELQTLQEHLTLLKSDNAQFGVGKRSLAQIFVVLLDSASNTIFECPELLTGTYNHYFPNLISDIAKILNEFFDESDETVLVNVIEHLTSMLPRLSATCPQQVSTLIASF